MTFCFDEFMNYVNWKFSFDLVPYNNAVSFMEHRVKQIYENNMPELIWLLEHPSLYTAGVSARDADLLDKHSLPVYRVNRGGKYTYHGPGQKVIYVMLDLNKQYRSKPNLADYIFNLEQWIINILATLKLNAERRSGRTGVWVVDRYKNTESKIAAIGVKIRRWITYHGIALNVNPELSHYSGIVPCGIKEYGITSLAKMGVNLASRDLDEIIYREFYKIFER